MSARLQMPQHRSAPNGFDGEKKTERSDGEPAVGIQIAERALPSDAVFMCAICHNISNPCFYDAECRNDGHCECVTGSSGVLCQLAPNRNGRCDPFFNDKVFNDDGGECCESIIIYCVALLLLYYVTFHFFDAHGD
jgi:hypothetical protein